MMNLAEKQLITEWVGNCYFQNNNKKLISYWKHKQTEVKYLSKDVEPL